MKIKELARYCLSMIQKYPTLENTIKDFYQLALDEIEEGGSQVHECEMCYMAIEGEIQCLP